MADTNGTAQVASPSTAGPPNPSISANQNSNPTNSNTTPQTPYYTSSVMPATSLDEKPSATADTVRPRDARTIHMVLTALGVTAYQERVPLQLLDFAYRYTSSVLSDALHLCAEGYVPAAGPGSGPAGKGGAAAAAAAARGAEESGGITIGALRLATSSRQGYQFSGGLPKETLLELAAERNRVKLPVVEGTAYGVRLPHERFCLTGQGWDLVDEWESEGSVEVEGEDAHSKKANGNGAGDEEAEDAEMDDGYQAVFGGDEQQEEDQEMAEG